MEPRTLRDPRTYDGQAVCPRCGSGWPCCADRRRDGTTYTHEETCARYRWADWPCALCKADFMQHS